ncbi:hypothetical protein AMATHDRAFT_65598, partial [Amanita thiersii Skay4041]
MTRFVIQELIAFQRFQETRVEFRFNLDSECILVGSGTRTIYCSSNTQTKADARNKRASTCNHLPLHIYSSSTLVPSAHIASKGFFNPTLV